ncbi:MAG: cupin domain-containing protein [Candidatus Saccharimonadales bacterium]
MINNSANIIQTYKSGNVSKNPNPLKGNEAVDLGFMTQIATNLGWTSTNESVIFFDPGGYGGDHEHLRQELMVVLRGNPTLLHRDESGGIIETSMGRDDDGNLSVFYVPSWVPHCVVNPFDSKEPAVLYEVRDRISSEFRSLEGTLRTLLPLEMQSQAHPLC